MKYSWQLEGFDENWSKPSFNDFATYTNLESGSYKFKVRAHNKYNLESKFRSVEIIILSPWWASFNAFIVYAILAMIRCAKPS